MRSDNVVLPKIVLKSDVYTCLRELDTLTESVYRSREASFENVLKTTISSDLHHAVIETMKELGLGNTEKERTSAIEMMKQKLLSMPVLKLEIAVISTGTLLEKIHGWAKANLGEDVVLEVVRNVDLIGGARITYRGKYVDKSLAKRWPMLWKKVRPAV